MPKTYVLDTNVLIQSPSAINSFEDNTIVLPIAVLEELDSLKTADGETGAGARQVIRRLEDLRTGNGNLIEGVRLPNGGALRLELNYKDVEMPSDFPGGKNDNRILKVCLGLQRDGKAPILVTKDIVVRIKAETLGIPSQDFVTEQVSPPEEQYTGRLDAYCPDAILDTFTTDPISPEDLYQMDSSCQRQDISFIENQFLTIHSDLCPKKTFLGRYEKNLIVPLDTLNQKPFNINPRNAGQRFLQEALMKPPEAAPLVIVKGPAGTAKTFYSLAVGLHQVMEESRIYRRILVTRPNAQFDDEIGFLPGTEQEKISPLLRPVIDNLEILVDQDESQRYANECHLRGKIDELFDRGIIMAEAMNFIRGRSITHTYLIIDEAQNLTPRQAKGIITRAGKGTKVVFLGDPHQIDHPLLDERTNGLSYASEKMKDSPYCYQITMRHDECERSMLAADAAKRM